MSEVVREVQAGVKLNLDQDGLCHDDDGSGKTERKLEYP